MDARRPARDGAPRTLSDIVAGLLTRAVTSLESDPASCREFLSRATDLLATSRSLVRPVSGYDQRVSRAIPWRIRNVLTHIEKTLPAVVRVDEVAGMMGMSSSLFFRTFKAAVGASPRQYITRRRIEMACSMMLSTRESLSEIAVAAGFYDQSQLCKAFRKVLGVSPGCWRRQRIAQRYCLKS
jgi:AraC family transcriptional regulator